MQKTILFQGDSITDAGRERNEEAALIVRLGLSYAGKIAGRLIVDNPKVDWTFYNYGVSGDRIVDLYARWKRDALTLKPDIISILIGINDTWHEHNAGRRPNGVEVPRYERIYRELLTWTKQELPKVQLVLMEPYLLPAEDKLFWMPEVKQRQKVVKKLAKEFNATFVPLQKPLEEQAKLCGWQVLAADGVHPTLAGHQFIADKWLEAVKVL